MTCLTVSSTIHPISAPTGTDADMGGNDKRKPSDVCDTNNLSRLQRDFFLDPDTSGPDSLFYDTSRGGMHHRRLRKTQGVAAAQKRWLGSTTGRGRSGARLR